MAFKKFTLARLIEPYRRKYVGLGSEEELNAFLNPTATSAELADPTSDINTVDKYAGKPAYDTTLGEPVWADGPLPSDGWSQASGGGGGGSALETQDNGVSLSVNTALYNFEGFTLTETVADEFTVAFGVVTASEVYCPGYTSYSQVSGTELTVDLVNAVNTYRNRRVRIQDNLGNFDFGVVNAIDFDSTQPNDTYMSLTMDGGDSVPASITDVCVVSDTANWSPIAGDPFNGNPINDICTGAIGSTQWWFAVGNDGRVATSNDGGATWALRSTVTTEHLRCCTYDSINEQFWAGGDAGVLVNTTDAINITEDTTSIPALATTGDGRIRGLAYSEESIEGLQVIFLRQTTPAWASAESQNQGGTWTLRDSNVTGTPTQNHSLKAAFTNTALRPGPRTYMPRVSNTLTRLFLSIEGTDTNGDSLGSGNTPNAGGLFNDGTSPDARVWGCTNGNIIGSSNWVGDDTTTFIEQVQDFAYSSFHDRLVCVGDNGQIGYWDGADKNVANAWNVVQNGFDPTTNINAVDWNSVDGVFVAVAENGQIARSSNGTN